jgi:hypothetical protein
MNEHEGRVPGRWWWFRITLGVVLMIWRTVLGFHH